MDIHTIFEALSLMNFTAKGDFETQKDYNARLASNNSSPLYGNLTLTSTLAFALPIEVYNIGYNIDEETINFAKHYSGQPYDTFLYSSHNFGTPEDDYAVLESHSEPLGSYEASNAMGAKVTVSKIKLQQYSVAFLKPQFPKDVNMKMNPDEARRAVKQSSLLIIGKLRSPYRRLDSGSNKPTISNPIELHSSNVIVVVNVSDFWIYNSESGMIYKKLPLRSQSKPAPRGQTPAQVLKGLLPATRH